MTKLRYSIIQKPYVGIGIRFDNTTFSGFRLTLFYYIVKFRFLNWNSKPKMGPKSIQELDQNK